MPADHIQEDDLSGGVARVRIARPEKKNALTAAMYDGLRQAIASAEADPSVRVLILAAQGDTFTAGNDLQDFRAVAPRGGEPPAIGFLRALAGARKPVIAAVNGAAIGIGTTLLLHCDLVVASDTARFQLPFVTLGLVPEAASSLLLPRLLGHVRAAELLLLCEPLDAATALAHGLVNRVVPAGLVESTAIALAVAVAAKPAAAVQHTKALLKSAGGDVAARMTEETALFSHLLGSPEARAAIAAVLARRASAPNVDPARKDGPA